MTALQNQNPKPVPDSGRSPEGRLDSWKEIAVYLGRGVRTVQRWEREEGLPVHRLAHEKRGSVYAHREEIDAWWESRRLTLAPSDSTEALKATESAEAPAPPRLERVTRTSAATFWPALSSDGRMVAYVSDGGQDGTTPQICLQQIGGEPIRLTNGQRQYLDLSFSGDDTRLIFTAKDDAGQNVYEMPTLGGEPRLLKRAAAGGRVSSDGKWLAYAALDPPGRLRIASLAVSGDHVAAPGLIDVSTPVWSPDNKHVLVRARQDSTMEPDYWTVAIETGEVVNTRVVQKLLQQGYWLLPSPPAWVQDSFVFSAVSFASEGINLWRQRIAPATLLPIGDVERLTRGTDMDWFPTAANARIAYVATHPDQNIWSVRVDPSSGLATGALRRMTRGPGIVAHLSVTSDGRTLAYFQARKRLAEVMLRDVENNSATPFAGDSAPVDKGFPALSPSGAQLAYSTRMAGPRSMRPIFMANMADGATRLLCDDCGGRPRAWVDERFLIIETFGSRLNTFALIDTTTGSRRELVASPDRSVSNPRVGPDGRWIAFDATRPGASPSVFVAPLDVSGPTPEAEWVLVDRAASHPFWSADGCLLYYLPTTPTAELRGVVRARRFSRAASVPEGDSFVAFASNEMVVPAMVTGAAPVATADQIILVLGDFRGDIWTIDLK